MMELKIQGINEHTKYIGEIPTHIVTKADIDLHGKTVEEAIPLVENFLKESYDANLGNVRIIHGKGIGVLRQAIRDYLDNHGLVSSFGPADKNNGGEGATEVRIVDLLTH